MAFIDIGVIYFLTGKYLNWPIGFFLVFGLGLFFKRNHWPLAGFIMTLSAILISIFSLVNSIRFQITFRHNSFLRWFGLTSNIVVALFIMGFVFYAQHWPEEIGNIFSYTGSILFLISILGMVFTLPNSNYIGWSSLDRKVFLRTVITPMAFVFILICLVFIFNDAFRIMMNKDFSSTPWSTDNLKLFDFEGISKY